jgi:hypothetical protein
MAKRPNQMRWIMVAGGILLVGVLLYSTLQQTHRQFEVCMSFKGGSHCATASGATEAEAIRSAHDIDCELLSNGRDEIMACGDQAPSSVREVK